MTYNYITHRIFYLITRASKFFLYLTVSSSFFILSADFCQKQTKGFRLQNIYPSTCPVTNIVDTEKYDEKKIKNIINQPFRFMKKGQQCFVFLSEDRQYVIKFFRWEKLEPPFWTKWIHGTKSQSLIQDRKKKQDFDFCSYQIASRELKEETGLIFIQLPGQQAIKNPIEIYDNIGIRHIVASDRSGFILQKKTENFFPYLKEKIKEGKSEDLHPFLSSLATLLINRAQNKITDSDISLEYNMGILENKPVLFDIGNLQKESSFCSEKELVYKQARLVLSSLKKEAPELALFFEKEIEKKTIKIAEQEKAQ